jgi:hypothetical protein
VGEFDGCIFRRRGSCYVGKQVAVVRGCARIGHLFMCAAYAQFPFVV